MTLIGLWPIDNDNENKIIQEAHWLYGLLVRVFECYICNLTQSAYLASMKDGKVSSIKECIHAIAAVMKP